MSSGSITYSIGSHVELLCWDIYEIRSSTPLQGMMLRGRLRKFANQKQINFLTENDEDGQIVRFALIAHDDATVMNEYVRSLVPDAKIEKVGDAIPNPVLSKLKVNLDDRYN